MFRSDLVLLEMKWACICAGKELHFTQDGCVVRNHGCCFSDECPCCGCLGCAEVQRNVRKMWYKETRSHETERSTTPHAVAKAKKLLSLRVRSGAPLTQEIFPSNDSQCAPTAVPTGSPLALPSNLPWTVRTPAETKRNRSFHHTSWRESHRVLHFQRETAHCSTRFDYQKAEEPLL